MRFAFSFLVVLVALSIIFPERSLVEYDWLIRNGTVYDGSGSSPHTADIAIIGDSIAAMGDLSGRKSRRVIDAGGLAVAPGFINMLSWAEENLVPNSAC